MLLLLPSEVIFDELRFILLAFEEDGEIIDVCISLFDRPCFIPERDDPEFEPRVRFNLAISISFGSIVLLLLEDEILE